MKNLLTILMLVSVIGHSYAQQKMNVDSFNEISLRTAGKVYITQGSSQSVEVSGDKDVINETEFYVKNGKFIIDNKDSRSWFSSRKNDDLTIKITVPKINDISVSSSGYVVGQNKIKTDDMELSLSGSGRMELQLEADDVSASISGSGRVAVSGAAENFEVSISGSGKVAGDEFEVDNIKASISGSGSCYVHANNSIDARISGSGSIRYSGDPEKINSRTSGSGSVKKM